MTVRQSVKFDFPPWFRNLLFVLAFIGGAVTYHVTLVSRITKLETEYEQLKESYQKDVIKLLENTEEIIKKLPDKK